VTRRRRSGFLLVAALLISIILLTMGMALLGTRVTQYKSALLVAPAAQARAIAEAGMEDAKIKLEKDLLFPPPGADEQTSFTYAEPFTDVDGTSVLGSYTVTVDIAKKNGPFFIYRLTSTSVVGSAEKPTAMRTITAELDVSPRVRGGSMTNPGYYKLINWQDLGGL